MRLALVLLAMISASVDAQTPVRPGGTLRGRVDVRRALTGQERRPGVSEIGTPAPRDLADRRRAIVYLESAPRAAFDDRELPRPRLDQKNETFAPHVLAVLAGTTVDFPNNDTIFHNVFSLSKARRFDLGRYPQGRSKSVRFDRPGVVRVFCDIHSHMSAFIVVFSHPYFAASDGEGRYRIENIPPGTYSVAAWYEGENRSTRSITVSEGGTVEADFVIP